MSPFVVNFLLAILSGEHLNDKYYQIFVYSYIPTYCHKDKVSRGEALENKLALWEMESCLLPQWYTLTAYKKRKKHNPLFENWILFICEDLNPLFCAKFGPVVLEKEILIFSIYLLSPPLFLICKQEAHRL